MNARYLFAQPDGSIAVVIPLARRRPGESDEERSARVLAKAVPQGAEVIACEESDLPADRTFRDAWRLPNGTDPELVEETSRVSVHMPACREIHMYRLRLARDAELARLDIEQLKGEDVAAAKQRLRDLPATIDLESCTTPAEVKAVWPEDLKGQPLPQGVAKRAR